MGTRDSVRKWCHAGFKVEERRLTLKLTVLYATTDSNIPTHPHTRKLAKVVVRVVGNNVEWLSHCTETLKSRQGLKAIFSLQY